jgi:hypothetical protein
VVWKNTKKNAAKKHVCLWAMKKRIGTFMYKEVDGKIEKSIFANKI